VGGNNSQISTFIFLMSIVFKEPSIKRTFVSLFSRTSMFFRLKPKIKSTFTEFTSFKSFLAKLQAFILDESHPLFVKSFCKSACENLDGT